MSDDCSKHSGSDARTSEFVRLLGRYELELSGYVISLVPNWADADEITQETKLRLWEQFGQYDPTKDFGAWARAIAYYLVLDQRKRSQRTSARFSQRFIDAVSRDAATLSTDAQRLRQALHGCIAKLGRPAQELLRACYAGNESIKAVAIRLGRSVRGTQHSVAQIRIKLQHCVESAMREEERL